MDEVQVFYSYILYNNGVQAGFGSGSYTGSRSGSCNGAMDEIVKLRNCTYQDIHLIAFNLI